MYYVNLDIILASWDSVAFFFLKKKKKENCTCPCKNTWDYLEFLA